MDGIMRMAGQLVMLGVAAMTPGWAIVTLGASAQNFTLTGIGPNAMGQGQSRMAWGDCAFDGTTTTCTLSGSYTGLGNGGTYRFIVSYAGNGQFPLNAITNPGSDMFFARATGPFTFRVTLTENNGPTTTFYSFANFNFVYQNATCTGSVSSCGPSAVGQLAGATITGRITGTFNPAPTILANGVISAGNYGGSSAIASGTWVEIYGANLATTTPQTWSGADFRGDVAPTALGGTTVTIGGRAAFVNFVSPGQANVQVPAGVATGRQPLVVTTAGGSSAIYTVTVNGTEPGLLAPPVFTIERVQHVAALFANTLTFVLPVTLPGVATARAKPGDNLTMYGIGFGPVTPDVPPGQIVRQANEVQSAFRITFAGVPAVVRYAGLAPEFVGLYQFNVVVPEVADSDTVPVAFTLGGVSGTQNLVIAVRR